MKIDLVETPIVGREVIAAAANHAGVDQRITPPRPLRGMARIISECLRADLGTIRDAAQKAVLELVVLEIGGGETRPLLEYHDRKARLGEFARHDSAGRARTDHDEIHGLAGFELVRHLKTPSRCKVRNRCTRRRSSRTVARICAGPRSPSASSRSLGSSRHISAR